MHFQFEINRLENAYMYTAKKIVCSAVSYCIFEANETLEEEAQMYGLDVSFDLNSSISFLGN